MQAQARTTETLPGVLAASWHPRVEATELSRQAALDVLERFGARRKVRRGQEIYAAGDPAEHCYRIVSGCVRSVGLDADGRRCIAEFLLPGELFGFDALGAHHLSAEAVTDAVVLCYPRRVVESLAEQHGALGRRLRDHALRSLRRAHGQMFLLGRKTAGERLAAFLLEMAARLPAATGGVGLPMTRADIADHLGLTIETVSRNMARLCRDGTIAATKRGIEIRDRMALEGYGAGNARH